MSKVSKLLFSCVLLGSTIGTVQAETQYVTENLNTYLRKGAGDQFKIAGAIQSGEAVTVLGQEGKYTLIRDNKNREAWILTSELSATPSSREENPKLKAQVQELTLKSEPVAHTVVSGDVNYLTQAGVDALFQSDYLARFDGEKV